MENLDVAGIAFEISKDSPIALPSLRLTSNTSSNALDTQRKARDVPTLPLLTIEISQITRVYLTIKIGHEDFCETPFATLPRSHLSKPVLP